MTTENNDAVTLHHGRVFRLNSERILLPNGRYTTVDIIRHPGASAIVPVRENGNVVLLYQYRYAAGGYIWEIPAGTVDGTEEPLACAKRELEEETGYAADTWHPLGAITPVPGYSDEKIHLYLATGLSRTVGHLDPDEVIAVHEFPYSTALEMVVSGEIQDAKTISGLFLADRAISRFGHAV
jgi:ADP-ribose pyrophosphatase